MKLSSIVSILAIGAGMALVSSCTSSSATPSGNESFHTQAAVTRAKAEAIIKKAYGLPRTETHPFYSGNFRVKYHVPSTKLEFWVEVIGRGERYLLDQGIRTAGIISESKTGGFVPDYIKVLNLSFSEGNLNQQFPPVQYSQYTTVQHVPVVSYSLGAITSLRSLNANEYEVVYSIAMTPNEPFLEATCKGIAIPSGAPKRRLFPNPEQVQRITQKIVKYDDGWRILEEQQTDLSKALGIVERY